MNRIALAALVIVIIIVAVLLLGYPLGFYSPGKLISSTCMPNSGYTCSNAALRNGSLTMTVGQLTGAAWAQANIFVVAAGQTPMAVPPLPCEEGFAAGMASGQYVAVSLSSYSNSNTCAGFSKMVGSTFTGTVWAGYRTSINGTESIVEIGGISLTAS